ncbi:F0F1 ATP synthase subunit epsilon [Hydrogenivirga sp.]
MKLLELKLITPETREDYRIRFLSLEDVVGSLGIYPGHDRFITVLNRSVGHFVDEGGDKRFIAYDHGFLKVEKDVVVLLSRAVVVGDSLRDIREELEERVERIEIYERDLRKSIENLEKAILRRLADIERGLV